MEKKEEKRLYFVTYDLIKEENKKKQADNSEISKYLGGVGATKKFTDGKYFKVLWKNWSSYVLESNLNFHELHDYIKQYIDGNDLLLTIDYKEGTVKDEIPQGAKELLGL